MTLYLTQEKVLQYVTIRPEENGLKGFLVRNLKEALEWRK